MSAPRPLVLYGASGLGREAAEAVRAANAVRPTWDLLGFLDDDVARHGTDLSGLPVLGPGEALADLPAGTAVAVCTAGAPGSGVRARLCASPAIATAEAATIVHPAASLGSTTALGAGAIVLAGVVATADVAIGHHCVLMPSVVLTHDDQLGDRAILGAGVRLAGRVRIGVDAYVGAGATVRQDVVVGDGAVVGMGSVVLSDVPDGSTWVGSPARPLEREARTP